MSTRDTRTSVRRTGKTALRKDWSPLSELIRRWMKESKAADRVREDGLYSRWREIVGDDIAAKTRIVNAAKGELTVEVDSAPLLNELSTYYRQEILASLRAHEEFRGIQKLRFRAGSL